MNSLIFIELFLLIKRKSFYGGGSCFHVKQRKALAKWPDINSRFTVLTCETEESISTMFFFLPSMGERFNNASINISSGFNICNDRRCNTRDNICKV